MLFKHEILIKTHNSGAAVDTTYLFWPTDGKLIIMVSFVWIKIWSNFVDIHRHLQK